MFKCEGCGGEFKSSGGLKRHQQSCKPTEEVKEPIKEVSNEVVKNNVLSEDAQRRLDKLIDARKSMYSAQGRHDIDMQIKAIMDGM